MKVWLTGIMVVTMLLALFGGCQALGVPEDWCGLSAVALWAVGILGLTTLWAPAKPAN
jgi:hypothetical protein